MSTPEPELISVQGADPVKLLFEPSMKNSEKARSKIQRGQVLSENYVGTACFFVDFSAELLPLDLISFDRRDLRRAALFL